MSGAPRRHLHILERFQKRVCKAVGRAISDSLETLAHGCGVASLGLFHRYYFGKCLTKLAELIPLYLTCSLMIDIMHFALLIKT